MAPRGEVVCGCWHRAVLLPAAGLSLSLPADAGTDTPQPRSLPPGPQPHLPFSPSPPSSRVPEAHVRLGDGSMPGAALPRHGAGSPPHSPDVQHVGDDAHAPHVRGVGDLLVVDHLGGEEFGGAEVHLQLLLGVVPAAGGVSQQEGDRLLPQTTASLPAGTALPSSPVPVRESRGQTHSPE